MSFLNRFFGKKKRVQEQLNAIKLENVKKKAELDTKLDMLNDYVEKNPDDIAARIFLATGGEKRMK